MNTVHVNHLELALEKLTNVVTVISTTIAMLATEISHLQSMVIAAITTNEMKHNNVNTNTNNNP